MLFYMGKASWWLAIVLISAGIIFWRQWPDQYVHIIVCDVGQGDAMLMTYRFNQVLIDGGEDNGRILSCLGKHLPFWDRELELVVATHPEADHIGGLTEVIIRYQVENVVMPDAGKSTQVFWDLYQAVRESGTNLAIADTGMRIKIGGMELKVISRIKMSSG